MVSSLQSFKSNSTTSIYLIDLPQKNWRPKVVSNYSLPEYATDNDDGIFDYRCYGNCVFRPKPPWDPGCRNDEIIFDPTIDHEELSRDLHIDNCATPTIRYAVIELIKKFWDYFEICGCK